MTDHLIALADMYFAEASNPEADIAVLDDIRAELLHGCEVHGTSIERIQTEAAMRWANGNPSACAAVA